MFPQGYPPFICNQAQILMHAYVTQLTFWVVMPVKVLRLSTAPVGFNQEEKQKIQPHLYPSCIHFYRLLFSPCQQTSQFPHNHPALDQ